MTFCVYKSSSYVDSNLLFYPLLHVCCLWTFSSYFPAFLPSPPTNLKCKISVPESIKLAVSLLFSNLVNGLSRVLESRVTSSNNFILDFVQWLLSKVWTLPLPSWLVFCLVQKSTVSTSEQLEAEVGQKRTLRLLFFLERSHGWFSFSQCLFHWPVLNKDIGFLPQAVFLFLYIHCPLSSTQEAPEMHLMPQNNFLGQFWGLSNPECLFYNFDGKYLRWWWNWWRYHIQQEWINNCPISDFFGLPCRALIVIYQNGN